MKKTIILILALFAGQFVWADAVTEEQARRLAAEFFASQEVKTKASSVSPRDFKLVDTFPKAATKTASQDPLLYVFQRETGGYAIVSGDDVARPILGYSLGNNYPADDMPDNMLALLEWYAQVLEFAREKHWKPSPKATPDMDPANSVRLHTVKWSQQHPFNDLVAEINGKKPPVGCVATSIAILMRYYQWPQRGKGTLASYDYVKEGVTYHVDGFPLGHEYDWTKMPEDYRHCNEEEAAQMARLLYDIAVMSQMSFYPGGSGAPASSALKLAEYFDYDKSAVYFSRKSFLVDQEWENRIKEDLDAARPVLYTGYRDSGSGHAFVIDGYNGRYFSINYGWGGSTTYRPGHDTSDEWVDYYTLTPIDGHEEDLLIYNEKHFVLLHVMPNQGGTAEPQIDVLGKNSIPDDFGIGKAFSLRMALRNLIPTDEVSPIVCAYALYNRNGVFKKLISEVVNTEVPGNKNTKIFYVICSVNSSPSAGDFVAAVMKNPHTGEWEMLPQEKGSILLFTDEPLAKLIDLGYKQNPDHPDDYSGRKRDISLSVFKDLCWSLYNKNAPGKSLLNQSYLASNKSSDTVSFYSVIEDNRLDDKNRVDYEIWLPAGTYILKVRNPLTNEEWEITLEV